MMDGLFSPLFLSTVCVDSAHTGKQTNMRKYILPLKKKDSKEAVSSW